jgi:2-hydroxycyclohexanecarboxyl-CoA dehydrogenase
MRLKAKVALVTGAGGGLGTAIATRFAAEGASVLCADRNLESVEATVSTIAKSGGSASSFQADVADPLQCEAQVTETVQRFGRLGTCLAHQSHWLFPDRTGGGPPNG